MRLNTPVTDEEYVLPDGEVIITRTDLGGRITYANEAFLTSSGFSLEECMGQPQNMVRHPDMPPAAFADLWRTIRAGKAWSGLVKNRRKNGGFYWVWANVTPMLDQGRAVGFMSVRVKPQRQEVIAAAELYQRMRQEQEGTYELREGELIDRRWVGQLKRFTRVTLLTRTRLIALAIALLLTLLAALSIRAEDGPLLLPVSLAGAGCLLAAWFAFHIRTAVVLPLEQAANAAVRIIGGEVDCRFTRSSDPQLASLLRLLNQMNAKMVGVLKDTHLGVNSMAVGAKEIVAANEDLSRRTSEHAAGLEETASSMEQLTAAVQQTTANAAQATALAARAADVTQRGSDVVHEVVRTMHNISEASRKMADILNVIDSITFQTNLLALNAAVEAARAGDHGRGFAVVAQEVRSLALRSSNSSRDIKGLINASLARIEEGTSLVGTAGQTMNEVVAAVKRVSEIMTEIKAAAQEQATGIEQINQAIAEMDGMTQEDSSVAQRVIEIATLQRHRSTRVLQAVSAFNLRGAADDAPRAATPIEAVPHADHRNACVSAPREARSGLLVR